MRLTFLNELLIAGVDLFMPVSSELTSARPACPHHPNILLNSGTIDRVTFQVIGAHPPVKSG